MAKVNFYLKNPTAKTETLIYLFFSYNGGRLKYSTGDNVNPKFWNSDEQRVKKSSGSGEINNVLDTIEESIKKIYRDAITNQHSITNEYLRTKLAKSVNPGKQVKKDFFDYFDEFVEIQKPTKTTRTIQKYNTLKNHLTEFQKEKRYSITFEKVDSRFYDHLTAYFINDLKLLNNSSAKYIKTLKTFLHWATERGYNTNLAYKKFKAKEKDADIVYLTEDELFKLYDHDFSNNKAFENVRDVFCFGCFTGLRYSDIARVNKTSIIGDEISLISEKTTNLLRVPINDFAKEILIKHNYKLPVISNQKTNEHLKTIAKLAKIKEHIVLTKFRGAEEIQISKPKHKFIGTHTARRTFVTLSLEKGMRPETVMSIVGHQEYNTFKKYIKLTSKVKLVEMKQIWRKVEPVLKAV